jgi:hypothetical protein
MDELVVVTAIPFSEKKALMSIVSIGLKNSAIVP